MKYFPWVAIAFVAIVIIAALFVVGSPAHQRQVRFDERRLNDLQALQYQIANFFANKGSLPASLSEISGFDGFVVPIDPESGNPYEYVVRGERQFQLCAMFSLDSQEETGGDIGLRTAAPYGKEMPVGSWRHPAGRGCFDLTLEESASGDGRTIPPPITVKPAV